MTKFARLTIQQWGNSLGVRIPTAVARAAHFEVEQEVEVTNHDGIVTVKIISAQTPTLAERPERFDPAMHGGEAMATSPLGREDF